MEYAKIQDRILVNQNLPQIYGMQFRYNADRNLEPFPILDPAKVDQRRREIGLEPLKDYLKDLSMSKSEITLSFDQINKILQTDLPYSAYHYRAWWANEVNGPHVQAHAWQDAGWKVESVDFNRKRVRFLRS